MPQVFIPVCGVTLGKIWCVGNHEKVFSIPFLRTLGEVEASCNHGFSVDDNDLIVGNLVDRIDVGRYSLVGEKGG